MSLEERKAELIKKIDDATSIEEVEKLEEEIRSLEEEKEEVKAEETQVEEQPVEEQKEEKVEEKEEISSEEERSLVRETSTKVEVRNNQTINKIFNGGTKMEEEKRFTTADAEYRSAWAKSLMGVELNEVEKRAIGDAVTTTATTFVAADASHNGINNAGLLIPDSVRMDLMKIAEETSPIYRDITKLQVNGNIDFPYLFGADDAEWYTEAQETKNEGQEYRQITLTGHELAKNIVITWKASEMTVESFISFLIKELNKKMMTALINAVIYGDGVNKPTGITNGLTAKTGANPIDLMKTMVGELKNEDRIGAKVYVSNAVSDALTFYKDANNNYPYLAGGLKVDGLKVEVDPYLHNADMIAGNCANYILNTNQSMRVDREVSVKTRKVTYGGYGIYDGNKKPGAFVLGQVSGIV